MMTAVILVGLPGAGKGVIAKEMLMHPERYGIERPVIVSLDNVREMLNGVYVFDNSKECLVQSMGYQIIKTAIMKRYDVIIDDTLLSIDESSRMGLVRLLKSFECLVRSKIQITCAQVNVPLEVCKQRRASNHKGLGADHWSRVIDDLSIQYEPVSDRGMALKEGFDSAIFF